MSAYIPVTQLDDAQYKRRVRAWALYDWANSAFATTILAAMLPVYYSQVAGGTLPSSATATQYWSITLSVSTFIIALLSPILGTVSDIMRGKKRFLSIFVTLGVIGTGLLVLVDSGDWFLASLFFVIGRIGFGSANVFYDALLPHVARPQDQDRISSQGYALGYLGGGLLLAINVLMFTLIPGTWGVRLSFLSVAVWWAVFSIPIFRHVPEPPAATEKLAAGQSVVRVSFQRIAKTLGEIRQYRELFKYLVAFLIYNDAINIIITVAAIYGAELGFGATELILAVLLVQFVGIPYSLVFGNLPSKSNKRQTRYVALVVYNIIMLPLVGILASRLLGQELTGRPSEDFQTIGAAVGQGVYPVTGDAFTFSGDWQQITVSADEQGKGCAWYALACDPAELTAVYATTEEVEAALLFTYNGQKLTLTHSIGPDHGSWMVEIDGAPALDGDGNPLVIDAFNPTVRFDESFDVLAEEEGAHELRLVNSDQPNVESSGTLLAIAQVEVLPPLRISSLPVIMGILLVVQLLGLVFAFLFGPLLFRRMAEWLNTKRSIFLALCAYAIVAVWGFFLNSVIEFWFLAFMVAIVQGGSQALSRSLYATLSPKSMSGEFFGLFSIMSRFASVISPVVFVVSVALFASSRPGVLSLIVFFLIGMLLLSRVDVAEGTRVAAEKDAAFLDGNAER